MTALRASSSDSDSDLSWLAFGEKHYESYDVPQVEPLLSEHLDNAFESVEAAFEEDPLRLYITAGQKQTSFGQALYKRAWKLRVARELKRKLAYTIDAGDAVILSTPPESDIAKPSPIDRTLDLILSTVEKVYVSLNRTEQMKRRKEVVAKMKKLSEEELRDRAKEMVYIDLLATRPEKQGHGFGTALLDTILFSADIRGRSVYLFTSNVANVPYYESKGFVRSAHVLLGDDNPKWENPPVIIPFMVREVKGNI